MPGKKKTPYGLVFVLGGASSGKSDVALKLASKGVGRSVSRVFLATGEGRDEEMAAKIARHRFSRSSAWVTVEVPTDLNGWIKKQGRDYRIIVVDCLTMWLSNHQGVGTKESQVMQEMRMFLKTVKRLKARVVLVANELGMGLVPVEAASRRFRDLAGTINRLVAGEADEVHLVVSGLSVQLK
jgi:adenosylcobinamide kinase/adenosylcobinamide-phosphate guanylyltransferase